MKCWQMRQFVVYAGVFGVKGKMRGGTNEFALLLAGGWSGCSRGLFFDSQHRVERAGLDTDFRLKMLF